MALPPLSQSTSSATTTRSIPAQTTSSSTPLTTSSSTPLTTSTSQTTSSSTSSVSVTTTTSISSTSSSSSSSSSSFSVTTPTTTEPLPTTSIPQSTSTFIVSLPTQTPTTSAASRATNTGFFSNKGAVAGVFTVVGLIGLAVIILVVTSIIRRRRAKQFDKDTAEAAMEAAASSHHHNFDDYGYPGSDPSGTNYGGFSAESHGTYGQPAMSHGGDAYMMHDVGGGGGGGYDGYGAAGEGYAGTAGTAGAAGIGAAAGAAAMQRARSRRSAGAHGQEDYGYGYEQTPYPAFAGPGAHPQQEMYDQPQSQGLRYRRTPGQPDDMMESAALGGAVGAGAGAIMNRRPSQPHVQAGDLARNKSQGSFGPIGEGLRGSPPQDESYASHYQAGGYSDGHGQAPEDPFKRNTLPPPPESALPNPHEAAYDGYDESHHAGGSDEWRHEGQSAEGRMSMQDDDDYAQPRVLKVANADSD